jgi:hypothetical protein
MISLDKKEEHDLTIMAQVVPVWVAVLGGVITPISFTANGLLIKHLVSDRIGFDPIRMTFSVILITNLVILVIMLTNETFIKSFEWGLFVQGFFGSILD